MTLVTRMEMRLFGPCAICATNGETIDIRGAKHRALLAMLATAPMGRRSRTFLQNTLWREAEYDSGHQNLRRALSDIRKLLGASFDKLVISSKSDVELDLDSVCFIGTPDDGEFLEDLNITDKNFVSWLSAQRRDTTQIEALYRLKDSRSRGRIRPRVAVLPLVSISTDVNLKIIGDWVAEDICRTLSRSNLIRVISHLSSRAYAGQIKGALRVDDTLDADFILSGSIRHKDGQIALDFDLSDAGSGNMLWTRHFDCAHGMLENDLAEQLPAIARAIGRSIAGISVEIANAQRLSDVADHRLLMAGVALMHQGSIRDYLKSRELLQEANTRAPKSPYLHAWMAKWYVLNVFKGLSTDRSGDTLRAIDLTNRALDLEPQNSFALTIDGFCNANLLKNLDIAKQRYGTALDLNPNESLSWLLRGTMLAFQDEGRAAVHAAETARTLSPIDPFGYYYDSLSSTAYLAAEDYENALYYADRSLNVNTFHISTLRAKITALHFLDRGEEARATAHELMRRHPDFSMEDYRANHPSVQNKIGSRAIEALTASGIH